VVLSNVVNVTDVGEQHEASPPFDPDVYADVDNAFVVNYETWK